MANKDNFNNQIYFISWCKIIVYGIVTPSIITFGIYYTFTIAAKEYIKYAIKEVLVESIDKSISKNFKELVSNIKKK